MVWARVTSTITPLQAGGRRGRDTTPYLSGATDERDDSHLVLDVVAHENAERCCESRPALESEKTQASHEEKMAKARHAFDTIVWRLQGALRCILVVMQMMTY